MGAFCSCLFSNKKSEAQENAIPLLEFENNSNHKVPAETTNNSPLTMEANSILTNNNNNSNSNSLDERFIRQSGAPITREMSPSKALANNSNNHQGSSNTYQENINSSNASLVGSSFSALHAQFAPEAHITNTLFPSSVFSLDAAVSNPSFHHHNTSSTTTTTPNSSLASLDAQKARHDRALLARIKASAELQKSLVSIVAKAEENFMDVRRGVDDIEREDPTDPAAVAFVRTLRQLEVQPLILPSRLIKGR